MNALDLYRDILLSLNEHDYQAYFVGGCVRNVLFKRTFDDVDIATDAPIELLKKLFSNYDDFICDKKFLNVSFTHQTREITITPFRIEGEYIKYRYPSTVTPTDDIQLDALRRDFTMNAIYIDADNDILDFFNGVENINERRLVSVKNADRSLSEDALRILRALRFMVVYDLRLDDDLDDAITTHASLVHRLSRKTLDKEIRKLQEQATREQQTEYYKQLIKYNIKI